MKKFKIVGKRSKLKQPTKTVELNKNRSEFKVNPKNHDAMSPIDIPFEEYLESIKVLVSSGFFDKSEII